VGSTEFGEQTVAPTTDIFMFFKNLDFKERAQGFVSLNAFGLSLKNLKLLSEFRSRVWRGGLSWGEAGLRPLVNIQ